MSRLLITVFFSVLSFQVHSGGSYFPVKIVEIGNNEGEFKLVAEVVGIFNYDSSGCKAITITGNYDAEKWKSYVNLISLNIHLESLRILEQASQSQRKINFGYIGVGLKKYGECVYKSKGLFHSEQGVFSIYTRI